MGLFKTCLKLGIHPAEAKQLLATMDMANNNELEGMLIYMEGMKLGLKVERNKWLDSLDVFKHESE